MFVDVTAAWCITCLVNEQAVLSRPDIKSAFAGSHVTYLVADWTNRNADITKLLDANDRPGPPLYLYYAPGAAAPVILPQILTEDGCPVHNRRLINVVGLLGGSVLDLLLRLP